MNRPTLLSACLLPLLGGHVVADTVTFPNGDTLTGEVRLDDTLGPVLSHPTLGDIPLPEQGVTIDYAPTDGGETPAAETDDIAAERRGLFGGPLFVGWEHSFGLGFSGSSGNVNKQSFNAEYDGRYEDDDRRWLVDADYFVGYNNHDQNQNEFTSEVTRDWLWSDSKWFWFLQGGYDFDRFEAWEHRVHLFTGPGYEFVKRDNLEVIGRLGAGFTKEFSGERKFEPEGLIGATVIKWKPNDRHTLSGGVTLYPSFAYAGEYRVESNAEWKIALDYRQGLSLKFGVKDEYDSNPADGFEHNDVKYYGAMVVDF